MLSVHCCMTYPLTPMILFPLCPASLMHRTRRSIDRSEPICVISLAVIGCCWMMHISLSLCCALKDKDYILILVNGNTEFWSLSSDCLVTGLSIFNFGLFFFNWDSLALEWDSWFFTRWVPGLTITIFFKITATAYPASEIKISFLCHYYIVAWPIPCPPGAQLCLDQICLRKDFS